VTEDELVELGQRVEAFRAELTERGDTSREAWLIYRQMRCTFLALAALFYRTDEAHALAQEARLAVLDSNVAVPRAGYYRRVDDALPHLDPATLVEYHDLPGRRQGAA
jgi:hypothetical protein